MKWPALFSVACLWRVLLLAFCSPISLRFYLSGLSSLFRFNKFGAVAFCSALAGYATTSISVALLLLA